MHMWANVCLNTTKLFIKGSSPSDHKQAHFQIFFHLSSIHVMLMLNVCDSTTQFTGTQIIEWWKHKTTYTCIHTCIRLSTYFKYHYLHDESYPASHAYLQTDRYVCTHECMYQCIYVSVRASVIKKTMQLVQKYDEKTFLFT
jgi:hypothetical protein